MWLTDFRVKFATIAGVDWPTVPVIMRKFQLRRIHASSDHCPSSEFAITDLAAYDRVAGVWGFEVPLPYGVQLGDPAAPTHTWAVRSHLLDDRSAVGEDVGSGEADFLLSFTVKYTTEPRWDAHLVGNDAMGCPRVLDKRRSMTL